MEDVITYLITATHNMPAIQRLIFIVAGVIGFVIAGSALMHQARNGRRGEGLSGVTVAGVIVGMLLMSLKTVVEVFAISFFQGAADTMIVDTYSPVGGDAVKTAIQALTIYIAVVGWFAAAKGLYMWYSGPRSGQPGWFGPGLVYIIAGMFCTNFYVLADVLAVSVGAMPAGTAYFKF